MAFTMRDSATGKLLDKHGMSQHPFYSVWQGMMERCYREANTNYGRYGGKGVRVCDEWHDPRVFISWLVANGWKKGMQIDRINNCRSYEPLNCRIVTPSENYRNRKSNHPITINGETKLLVEWAEISGINRATILRRIHQGWSENNLLASAYEEPSYTISGESHTLKQWAIITGIDYRTLWARVSKGWTGEDIIQPIIRLRRKHNANTADSSCRA